MPLPSPRDLLLAPDLDEGEILAVFAGLGFQDPKKADSNLQAIADDPRAREVLASIVEELLDCVAGSADPDLALTTFERFCAAAVHKVQLLSYLADAPQTLEILARTFGASPFMGDILVRHPGYLYWISDPEVLAAPRTRSELQDELGRTLAPLRTEQRRLDALRALKRRELLHIGVRDLLRLSSVSETLAGLSLLAEVLIEAALQTSSSALAAELGLESGAAAELLRDFVVLGLGKLGGGELNFSSDVDLVYVHRSDRGHVPRLATGRPPIGKGEYFARLARRLTAALSEVTHEGQVYRVDLRLRPEGRMGGISQSVRTLKLYVGSRGQTWERLAYLKAWPVAGSRELGDRVREQLRPFVFGRPFDAAALLDIQRMKEQIDRKVEARGQRHEDVKLGFGGIREIELCVQCLQVAFGRRRQALRKRQTLEALRAAASAGLLPPREVELLADAYLFLRDVENKLQMVSDAQTHTLPTDTSEQRRLALRLGYRDGAGSATDQFRQDYEQHTAGVHRILREVLHPEGGRLRSRRAPR
jgi:glutamate-ammonia-ligase adenylyltransferase